MISKYYEYVNLIQWNDCNNHSNANYHRENGIYIDCCLFLAPYVNTVRWTNHILYTDIVNQFVRNRSHLYVLVHWVCARVNSPHTPTIQPDVHNTRDRVSFCMSTHDYAYVNAYVKVLSHNNNNWRGRIQ